MVRGSAALLNSRQDDGMDHDEPAQGVGDKPEADAIEQAHPVDERRARVVAPPRDDVPEADWLEQSVVEPLDDDEPR